MKTLKQLFEAEEDEFVVDDEEVIDNEEDTTEIDDIDDEYDDNELVRREVSFPLLISAFDDEDNPTEANDIDVEDFVNEYSDTVIDNFEDNKKFILSALDMYDFEIYFYEFDSNSNIHFIIELSKDVSNDLLLNTIKRYFKVEVENFDTKSGYMTLSPVLETKYLIVK